MATIKHYCSEFERQLKLSNNAHSTIATYTGILKQVLSTIRKDPAATTPRMVEDYLLTLTSTRYKRQTIYTLIRFYDSVMKMPNHLSGIPIPKQEKFVPEILNVQEVYRFGYCRRRQSSKPRFRSMCLAAFGNTMLAVRGG